MDKLQVLLNLSSSPKILQATSGGKNSLSSNLHYLQCKLGTLHKMGDRVNVFRAV